MTIIAELIPLPVLASNSDVNYKTIETRMQWLGHLKAFREELNWESHLGKIEVGTTETLYNLKKAAARNDGVPLFWAKWKGNTVYQQLILHPQDKGYFLPFSFDEPFTLQLDNEKVWFGSSQKLLNELTWLEMYMNKKYDNESSTYQYWNTLKEVLEQSIGHVTPVKLITTGDQLPENN